MDYTKKLLEVRDLHKAYSKEGVPTKALNGITFDVLSGEYLGIMGASGSGKTTLLNCIATVIKPTSGQILLSGANISAFDGAKLAEYRGSNYIWCNNIIVLYIWGDIWHRDKWSYSFF